MRPVKDRALFRILRGNLDEPSRTQPTTTASLKYRARGLFGSMSGLWTLPFENTMIWDDRGYVERTEDRAQVGGWSFACEA
jgi:hypothetical protein